jgi:hypothetical protein
MPTIRQRNGRYHVQVRIGGFPARTKSFRTECLAKRWASTIEAEMIEGRAIRNVEARRRSFADAIDRYLEEVVSRRSETHAPGAVVRPLGIRWARMSRLVTPVTAFTTF